MGKVALTVSRQQFKNSILGDMYSKMPPTKYLITPAFEHTSRIVNPALQKYEATNALSTLIHFIADRPECETNPTILQLIPYTALVYQGKVFVYTRGQASGEQRLTGKCSIGLGGHIEETPVGGNVFEVYARSMIRELEEEVGLVITQQEAETMIQNSSVFWDEGDPTNRVHLAIMNYIHLTPEEFQTVSSREEGVIEKGQWVETLELLDVLHGVGNPEYESTDLEPWSQVLLNLIINTESDYTYFMFDIVKLDGLKHLIPNEDFNNVVSSHQQELTDPNIGMIRVERHSYDFITGQSRKDVIFGYKTKKGNHIVIGENEIIKVSSLGQFQITTYKVKTLPVRFQPKEAIMYNVVKGSRHRQSQEKDIWFMHRVIRSMKNYGKKL